MARQGSKFVLVSLDIEHTAKIIISIIMTIIVFSINILIINLNFKANIFNALKHFKSHCALFIHIHKSANLNKVPWSYELSV